MYKKIIILLILNSIKNCPNEKHCAMCKNYKSNNYCGKCYNSIYMAKLKGCHVPTHPIKNCTSYLDSEEIKCKECQIEYGLN